MTNKRAWALVDCNAFFCSCERLFRPELVGVPIVVLSNNDGCVVSTSMEARSFGIKIGVPYFEIKDLCSKYKIQVFSSNFTLYSDMSRRVMQNLRAFATKMQVYSIDEAFLDLSGAQNIVKEARIIKNNVWQNIGIPVSVGVGPNKVLAKLANRLAKTSIKAQGVVDLTQKHLWDEALKRTKIEDVWGIGRKGSEKLKILGINTALDLRDYKNEKKILSHLTKSGWQIQQELRGENIFSMEENPEGKKQIMCSRSFAFVTSDKRELLQKLAQFVTLAAEKMRSQKSLCMQLDFFLEPAKNSKEDVFYGRISIKIPTDNTLLLIQLAQDEFNRSYKGHGPWRKMGVILSHFRDGHFQQMDFWENAGHKTDLLMPYMDKINRRYGPLTLKSAACGGDFVGLKMKKNHQSPMYTTSWLELPLFK